MPSTLILGGIRSGKSRLAETEARSADPATPVTYLATAEALDDEMRARIDAHRARRPDDWGLVEEPIILGQVLRDQARNAPYPVVLIDCMSLWLSNLLHAGERVFHSERTDFLEALADYPGRVIIVSNEVGLGTIGMDALTRRYADEMGHLNQAIAAVSERVILSVAGQALTLKPRAESER